MMLQMESLNGEVSKLKESEKQARSGLTASEAKVGQLQKESQTVKEELERVKAEGKAAIDAARAKAAGTKELAAEKAKLEEEVKSLKVSERGPGAARKEGGAIGLTSAWRPMLVWLTGHQQQAGGRGVEPERPAG